MLAVHYLNHKDFDGFVIFLCSVQVHWILKGPGGFVMLFLKWTKASNHTINNLTNLQIWRFFFFFWRTFGLAFEIHMRNHIFILKVDPRGLERNSFSGHLSIYTLRPFTLILLMQSWRARNVLVLQFTLVCHYWE